MLKSIKKASLATLLSFPLLAFASDTGWYVGGDLGQSNFDLKLPSGYSTNGVSQSRRDVAFAVFGGYRLNRNISVEAGYQNLGEYKLSVGSARGQAKIDGITTTAVFELPMNERWGLFARAGVMFAKARSNASDSTAGTSASQSKDGVVPVIGFGASYMLDNVWTLRAQYQDVGAAKVAEAAGYSVKLHDEIWSVGATYKF